MTYPVQRALTLIESLREKLGYDRANPERQSKVFLYRCHKNGRQFGLVVYDKDPSTGTFRTEQSRVLLEELPGALPDVEPLPPDNFYKGGSVLTAASRLAPPNQRSVLVHSEPGLTQLLEWYTEQRRSSTSLELQHQTPPMGTTQVDAMDSIEGTNTILYGPPGTGKTFATIARSVALCDGRLPAGSAADIKRRYDDLRRLGRITVVTFHQSYGYEDFVEGLRPTASANGTVTYDVIPGAFRRACEAASRTQRIDRPLLEAPLSSRAVYKMSLGAIWNDEGVAVFRYALENDCILLGWGEDIDFSDCASNSEIRERVSSAAPSMDEKSRDNTIWNVDCFKHKIKIGDVIVAAYGNKKFRGIALVTGEYEFVSDAPFHHVRPVQWLAVYPEGRPVSDIYGDQFMMQTLYQLKSKSLNFEALSELIDATSTTAGPLPHVLVIDEINRANISKVFGELITLIEPDKRAGGQNAMTVRLPYSGEDFCVPRNLHVLGTMNTADRSIALLDTALRRRFDFEELMPNPALLAGHVVEDIDLAELLTAMNQRIEVLYDRDHTIGHAYLLEVTTAAQLELAFRRRIIPLLQEYFFENWERVRLVLNDLGDGNFIRRVSRSLEVDTAPDDTAEAKWIYSVNDAAFPAEAYRHIYFR